MQIDTLVHGVPAYAVPAIVFMMIGDSQVSHDLVLAVFSRFTKIRLVDLESPIANASNTFVTLSRMAAGPLPDERLQAAERQLLLLGAGDAIHLADGFVTALYALPANELEALEAQTRFENAMP